MIEHRLAFKCDECGKEWVQSRKSNGQMALAHNWDPRQRRLPEGWSWVRDRLICDEHQIIVKDEDNS